MQIAQVNSCTHGFIDSTRNRTTAEQGAPSSSTDVALNLPSPDASALIVDALEGWILRCIE